MKYAKYQQDLIKELLSDKPIRGFIGHENENVLVPSFRPFSNFGEIADCRTSHSHPSKSRKALCLRRQS